MNPVRAVRDRAIQTVPRMRGDEPGLFTKGQRDALCSPHARG